MSLVLIKETRAKQVAKWAGTRLLQLVNFVKTLNRHTRPKNFDGMKTQLCEQNVQPFLTLYTSANTVQNINLGEYELGLAESVA